jgi:Glycosyl transferase family 2
VLQRPDGAAMDRRAGLNDVLTLRDHRSAAKASFSNISCVHVMAGSAKALSPAPRVSVVLPVRDGATFLEQALESILSQTLRELELIVVDDGSTDATPQILAVAASRDPRVHIVQLQGSGLVAALNEGCAAAVAPYVGRLDADDVALPGRLERQAALLDADPKVGVVGGAYFAIDAAGRRRAKFHTPTGDAALRTRLARYNVFAHPATTFRREAFEQAGRYRLAEAEDYDLWLRISERWRLASIREPVLEYRHHRGQISLLRVREQALAAVAARVAADERRRGRQDPLDDVGRATPELLTRLGITDEQVARAVAENGVRWAATLAELGDEAAAASLLAASAAAAPYTRRQVLARYGLDRAAQAFRGGRRLRAATLLARALSTGSGAVAAELRAALGRRRPRRR